MLYQGTCIAATLADLPVLSRADWVCQAVAWLAGLKQIPAANQDACQSSKLQQFGVAVSLHLLSVFRFISFVKMLPLRTHTMCCMSLHEFHPWAAGANLDQQVRCHRLGVG